MPLELPDLPYDYDALEPHIDAETMRIHHGRHHLAYVTGANNLLKSEPKLLAKPVDELLADIKQRVTPVDRRTQCPLARGQVARAIGQQREAPLQSRQHHPRREQLHPRGG